MMRLLKMGAKVFFFFVFYHQFYDIQNLAWRVFTMISRKINSLIKFTHIYLFNFFPNFYIIFFPLKITKMFFGKTIN